MRGSLRLGQIAGIKVFVHWTFFLLIGWIFTMHMMAGRSPVAAAMGVVFILALFVQGFVTLTLLDGDVSAGTVPAAASVISALTTLSLPEPAVR